MAFIDNLLADACSAQGKRAAAIAGLAGGIDYLINGGNMHAFGVAGVVYSCIMLAEPYIDRALRTRYGERKDV